VQDPTLSSVTAHVIGRANRPFLDTMILDAGKNQGIKPGEAVVDDRGLIGRIYLVGQHTAWVILLTDLSSRIPVAVEPGHVQAILSGDNTTSPSLETSRPGVVLKVGQQIVTSGDGGLLPAGLPVGTVTWNGSEFRTSLLADATAADDVRILDLRQPPELPPTPAAGDLPAVAGGIAPVAQVPNMSPNRQIKPLQLPAGVPPPVPPQQPAAKPGTPPQAPAPAQDEDH
jgi:rod shape-determining protein MreC